MTATHHDDADVTVEVIPREECLRLLASQLLGRVAVADVNTAPLVVPVNFVVDGETVLFRTDAGSKFRLAVLGGHPVSFQVDGVDPGRRTGWSILLQGEAVEVDPSELEQAVEPWAPGRKDHWVRIVPSSISGRHLRLVDRPGDVHGYL